MADPQFCLMAIDHWSTCSTKAEWASWVQSIGAIAAIGAGFAGILWQGREQRRALLRQQVQVQWGSTKDHLDLLEHAQDALKTVAGVAKTDAYEAWLVSESGNEQAAYRHLGSLMAAADSKDVPSPTLKVALREARSVFAEAERVTNAAFQRATGKRWDAATGAADAARLENLLLRLGAQVTIFRDYAEVLRGMFIVIERVKP